MFNAKKTRVQLVNWIRDFFKNTNGDKAYDKKEKEKIVFDYKGSFFDYYSIFSSCSKF